MVIQIKVCQRFVFVVFVDSPHSSNEDHVKLDFPISLSVQVGNKHAVLCFCFLVLGIRPSVFTNNLPLLWIQFLVVSKLLKVRLRVVTREEQTVLGKNRMASGREEAFKA